MRKGEVEGREREGPKLLLNQGPSEPCYATGGADRKSGERQRAVSGHSGKRSSGAEWRAGGRSAAHAPLTCSALVLYIAQSAIPCLRIVNELMWIAVRQ